MKHNLTKAIYKLCPNSEFVIQNNDYSTIEWHVLEGDAPTQSEVDAAIQEIVAQEEADVAAKAADKAALLEKLGITAEEATLLLG
jgi:hypothetical protein